MTTPTRIALACILAFVAGLASGTFGLARAEQQAIDRALFERLIRAEEQQARQLEAISRAAQRCK